MPECALEDLPDGPLLALDPGSKTIGVAACGASRSMATAVETVKRTKFAEDAERIFALYDERKASGIVMGLAWAAGSLAMIGTGILGDVVGAQTAALLSVPALLVGTLLAAHPALRSHARPARAH